MGTLVCVCVCVCVRVCVSVCVRDQACSDVRMHNAPFRKVDALATTRTTCGCYVGLSRGARSGMGSSAESLSNLPNITGRACGHAIDLWMLQ